jgi:hypothetical protein
LLTCTYQIHPFFEMTEGQLHLGEQATRASEAFAPTSHFSSTGREAITAALCASIFSRMGP